MRKGTKLAGAVIGGQGRLRASTRRIAFDKEGPVGFQRFWWGVSVGLALTGTHIWASAPTAPSNCAAPVIATPVCPGPSPTPAPQAAPPAIAPEAAPAPPAGTAPVTDAFAQAPEAGTEAAASFNPNMFGDLLTPVSFGPVTVQLPNGTTQQYVPGTGYPAGTIFNAPVQLPNGTILPPNTPLPAAFANAPITGQLPAFHAGALAFVVRGAFKITENESPRPQDRVFGTYNAFFNVNTTDRSAGFPETDVHREVVGFEKTFLDGNASIGLRLPILQVRGDSSIGRDDIGDLSLILKGAIYNDAPSGNVLSVGLVVTVPTGPSFFPTGIPDIHPTLFQPWIGGIYNLGNLYVHGFTSVVIPTDERDVTILFNDIGVGYFVYRDQCGMIRSIVPTVEVHINTPLNHRGLEATPIGLPEIVDLTSGVTIGFGRRATLSLGIVKPLTGPEPFNVEAQAYLNYRF